MKYFFSLLIMMVAWNGFSQCEIGEIELIEVSCNNTLFFNAQLDFDYRDVGDAGFSVFGNGSNYGSFKYEDLPITLSNLTGNCETHYEFIIRDNANPTCTSPGYDLGQVCCAVDCSIDIVDSDISACEGGEINLWFDLATTNFFTDSVKVIADGGFSQSFALIDNTITIQDFNVDGADVVNFRLENPLDESCFTEFLYESDCVCNITNPDLQVIECSMEDSTYYVSVDFDHALTSDSFLIGGNSIFGGTFAYADLPLVVGPRDFSATTHVNFLIQDAGNAFCFAGIELGIINNCDVACNLAMANISTTDCEAGTKNIEFSIESSYESDQGFTFTWLDQVYGPFPYGESSYSIEDLPTSCGDDAVITLRDAGIETCVEQVAAPFMCCECDLWDLTIDVNCASGLLEYSFGSANSSDRYRLRIISGDEVLFQEHYFYNDQLPVDISTLQNGTYQLVINDSENENCTITTEFMVDCGFEICSLSNPVVERTMCADGLFNVHIDFDYAGVSDSFNIRGNGVDYGTFAYGETFYELTGLSADCETVYEFVIIDQADETCRVATSFDGPVCCNCFIEGMELNFLGCNIEGAAILEIVIDLDASDVRMDIDVVINDEFRGTFSPEAFPLQVPVSEGLNLVRLSTIDCNLLEDVHITCNACTINDLGTTLVSCENNLAVLSLDGIIEVDPAVEVFVNGISEGTYEDEDFPILIDNFMTNTAYTIELISTEYDVCQAQIEIDPFTCLDAVDDDAYTEKVYVAGNRIIIDTDRPEYNVVVSNIIGQQMTSVKNSPTIVDVSQWPVGIYLVTLVNEHGKRSFKVMR